MTAAKLKKWSDGALEEVPNCPICGCSERKLLHANLEDRIFFAAPGKWTMWQCARCGSGWLDPRPDEASIGLAYQVYYTHDDGAAGPGAAGSARFRTKLGNGYRNWRYGTHFRNASKLGPIAGSIFPPLTWATDAAYRFLPNPHGRTKRVLDIGCGNGRFLDVARDNGWIAAGVEPDPVSGQLARERGFDVRSSTDEWLGEPASFDAITISHVIEHLHDPLSLLHRAHSLLREGGTIFVDTPNVNAAGHRLYGANWRGLEPPRHLVLYSRKSLRQVLESAGFRKIRFHPRPDALEFTAPQSRRIAAGFDPYSTDEPRTSVPTPGLADKVRSLFGNTAEFLTVTAVK